MKKANTLILVLFFSCSWIWAQENSESAGFEIPAAAKSGYYQNGININDNQAVEIEKSWESLSLGQSLYAKRYGLLITDHALAGWGVLKVMVIGGNYYYLYDYENRELVYAAQGTV